MLINISAGNDMKMSEFEEISNVVINETGTAANIITGLIFDENLAGKISVTLIATGLKNGVTERVIDFPQTPSWMTHEQPKDNTKPPIQTPPTKVETAVDDDIDDIFKRLNITSTDTKSNLEKTKEDSPRLPNLRTDIPAFLKALD